MGLRLRLLLLLILPLVIAVAIYGVVRIRQQAAQLLETERKDAAATVRAVQIAVENALRDLRLEDIRRLGAEMVSEHAQIDGLRIYDDSLAPITAEPGSGRVDVAALRRVLASGHPETRFTEPGTFHYLLPLRGGPGSPRGVLEMSFRSTAGERVDRATKEIVLSVSLLTLGLALFTALILQRQVLRPLSRLTASIRALGAGRPGPPLPVERRDELGVVAEAFNRMVAQLDGARRQVESASEHMLDLEQQLRRAATLAVAGKLTSSIAHEVGTPLNIVSGRAELLMHSLPGDHPGRQELGVIIGQIDRISGIIRSLLDTVRPQKPEVQPVALRDVLDRLLPLLQHVVRRRGVELAAEVPADLPAVAADPGQLQQVLINLLMNAIEATPAGGRIGLRAWAAERDGLPGVAAAVTDTGTGIAPAALVRVFEPFFTTKPSGQGTGLGLSICRDIVREHAGTLTAESREGDGATFTLWLPRHEGSP